MNKVILTTNFDKNYKLSSDDIYSLIKCSSIDIEGALEMTKNVIKKYPEKKDKLSPILSHKPPENMSERNIIYNEIIDLMGNELEAEKDSQLWIHEFFNKNKKSKVEKLQFFNRMYKNGCNVLEILNKHGCFELYKNFAEKNPEYINRELISKWLIRIDYFTPIKDVDIIFEIVKLLPEEKDIMNSLEILYENMSKMNNSIIKRKIEKVIENYSQELIESSNIIINEGIYFTDSNEEVIYRYNTKFNIGLFSEQLNVNQKTLEEMRKYFLYKFRDFIKSNCELKLLEIGNEIKCEASEPEKIEQVKNLINMVGEEMPKLIGKLKDNEKSNKNVKSNNVVSDFFYYMDLKIDLKNKSKDKVKKEIRKNKI